MKDADLLKRISSDPAIMTGKPVIKGTRLTVETILNLLGHGMTYKQIISEYQGLTKEDILACELFASKTMKNLEFMPLETH